MATGTVKFFNMSKGYGFIVPDDDTPEHYFNWKNCLNTYIPSAGDIVQFVPREFPEGRRVANRVEIAR